MRETISMQTPDKICSLLLLYCMTDCNTTQTYFSGIFTY